MKSVVKYVAVTLVATLLVSIATPARAADSPLGDVFTDMAYGALIGAALGAATLAFTDKPSDHLDYLAVGAAIGAFAGTGYGLIRNSRSLVEIEHGKVRFAVPTIIPAVKETVSGKAAVVLNAGLIRGTFF